MMANVRFDYEDKNFVVVGASSGMGRKIAEDLSEAGAHVLAIARNIERLLEVKDKCYDRIDIHVMDVIEAKPEDWEQALGNFVAKHGKFHGGV